MCLFCFSSERLSDDELNGKYGQAVSPYVSNSNTYDITMCQAPCYEPCCFLGSMICFPCAQTRMRYKALNHVDPGSKWSNYKCCQGYFGGCCCLQPGSCGDKQCPCPCMCLESICCPGLAASATSNVIREQYQLGLDEDDVRLIRCNNCLQIFACCLYCVAICTDCEADDAAARCVGCIADVVFCCVSGCMTAQVNHEIKIREGMTSPKTQSMERN